MSDDGERPLPVLGNVLHAHEPLAGVLCGSLCEIVLSVMGKDDIRRLGEFVSIRLPPSPTVAPVGQTWPMTFCDIDIETIEAARARTAGYVRRTPLLPSHGLSDLLGAEVWCKPELFQPTGSYKVRGVFNMALGLSNEERSRGLISFSAGNLAMAVAFAGRGAGIPVTVCMPAAAVQFKVDAVRAMGANLELVDGDLVAHVMRRQAELGATMIHPFESRQLADGYAVAGLEIVEDLPDVDTVLVPVGGGGLIAGVAAAIKLVGRDVRIVGIEPENADVVRRSRAAGGPVHHPGPRSLADGLAAPVTSQRLLDMIDAFVDELVVVSEDAIAAAWWDLLASGKLAGEPSSAVGIAAIASGAVSVRRGEKVCLLISGGNADLAKLVQ